MNHFGLAAPAAQAIIWPFSKCWLTMIFLLAALSAQAVNKDWDGSVSTNWNEAANWTPAGVPVAGDVVSIFGSPTNKPVIFSGTVAKAARVTVYGTASLTINAGGELELASALADVALYNLGMVTNNGTLKVKSGFQGIENSGAFVNNGTIRLGEATSSPYAFTEEGIAMYADGGNFVNNSTGNIIILRPGNNGILLFSSGTSFTNYGKITVRNAGLNPATAETADGIDARSGDFVNETTGDIVISTITANGLNCRNSSASFTNKGSIKIGNVGVATALDFREGINNSSFFTNTATGQITIDTCTNNGVFNQGVIYNSGTISMGTSMANSIGNIGIVNLAGFFNYSGATIHIKNAKTGLLSGGLGGVFTNYSGATITIGQMIEDGINQFGLGGTDNRGSLNIGSTGSIGRYGIYNACQFLNQFGAVLTISNSANNAILNTSQIDLDGIFKNGGTISLNNALNVGGAAISNTTDCTFENLGCIALIHISSNNTISNTGTFTNEAIIIENASGNSSITNNSGIIQNLNGGTFSVTGSNTGTNSTATGAIWTGCANTDWDNSLNWHGFTVPVAVDNVTIPDRSNDPVLYAGTAAVAKSVTVQNNAILTLNALSSLTISGATGDGLTNAGTVSNAGLLSISNAGGIGFYNSGIFNNQACGETVLFDNLNNTSTFTNAGLLRMNTALAHTNSSTFTNNGIIEYPQGSLIPNVTNNDLIVKAVSGECPVANALQIGGANSFTAGTTWYKNQNLTSPAGTYNQAANTFTINGLTEGTTNTLYFSISDNANGCPRTVSIQLTYDDVTKPTINCPANQTVAASNTCSGVVGAWTSVSKSDNCTAPGNITESQSPASSTVLNGHNTAQTITLTANDGKGNTGTCTFTVTLKDVTKPLINCPANQTVAADNTCSGVIGAWALVSKSDNCAASSSISESQSPASSTVLSGYDDVETVTFTANDGNGNTQTCQFTVTLKDFIAPTIACPADQTVAADGACSAPVGNRTGLATNLTDNCTAPGNITVHQSPAANTVLSGHNDFEIITLRSDDGHGNQSEPCTFQVILKDITPPAITCPANIAKNTDPSQCSAVTNYTVNASDNCIFTTTQTNGFPSGTAFPTGVNVVNWQVTDVAGLTAICSFTVTVTDGQLPSIVCPANVSKTTDPGQCSAVATYSAPTFSDNCAAAGIQLTSGLASGSVFPKGTTMVNWKATDAAGNSSLCGFTVTVTDGQAPTITCPANLVKGTDAGQCTAVVTYTNPVYTDNCIGAGLDHISGGVSGSTFPKGVTSVVWQASDAANLTQRCTFTITVNDNQTPVITCPANQTKSTDSNLCTALANYPTPTFTDNCTGGGVTIQSGLTSGSAFPKGINTVTWKATDAAGLTKTCTFRITVNDTQAPTITCPANQTKTTDANLCTAVATYTNATFTDNCTGGSVVKLSGLNSGSAFPKGVNNVVFKATDAAGNQSLCTMTVTVTDAQLPTIACPANIVATGSVSNGVCSATVTYTNPTATDNCGILSNYLLSGLASGSVFPAGVTTNSWKATDDGGLTATCAFTVTVNCATSPETVNEQRESKDLTTLSRPVSGSNLALSLAPNPASTDLQITVEGLDESEGTLTIFDAAGRMVWQSTVNSQQSTANSQPSTVNLSNFASGLYQVRLMTGHRVVTKALVISKL